VAGSPALNETAPAPDARAGPSYGVNIEGVAYRYPGGVTALEGLTMTIPAKSSLGVVGPSGCGKSTLLQLLTGLREPSRGTINWPAPPPGVHPMAMVFQSDTLLPWKTAAENIGLHFKFRRSLSRSAIKQRVAELLELVGLQDFADAYPYELSGGMRRRVAFLTAVAPMPAALLLDEPFSSLDEPTRVAIHRDVIKIITEFEMTVVLVTHDLAEAITLCNEVVILTRRPGRVYSRHRVPFGRERKPLELRQTKPFLDLYATLWEELSRQIAQQTVEESG
jgi:NitT/TauT family transport system ATP-binding protein